MHLAIAGLNAWSVAFLAAALAAGLLRAPWHVTLGVLAAIISILSQSAVFALFIGAAKTLKETVGLYGLEASFIDRTNRIYFAIFPWAVAGAVSTAGAAILGGAARGSSAGAWAHGLLAGLALAVNGAAAFPEHRQLRRMHLLLAEMAVLVPKEAGSAAVIPRERRGQPGGGAAADQRARGRAILTLGGLALATLLGYRYAAGAAIPAAAMVALAIPIVLCMGLGIYHLARGAGVDSAQS